MQIIYFQFFNELYEITYFYLCEWLCRIFLRGTNRDARTYLFDEGEKTLSEKRLAISPTLLLKWWFVGWLFRYSKWVPYWVPDLPRLVWENEPPDWLKIFGKYGSKNKIISRSNDYHVCQYIHFIYVYLNLIWAFLLPTLVLLFCFLFLLPAEVVELVIGFLCSRWSSIPWYSSIGA